MKHTVIKGIGMVLALLLLCGTTLAQVRTTGNVWMRSGPGLDFDVVASFGEGKTLEYLGETETDDRGVAWYKVSDGEKTGWISSRYSELIGESAGTDDETDGEAAVEPAETEPVSLPALNAGILLSGDEDEAGDGSPNEAGNGVEPDSEAVFEPGDESEGESEDESGDEDEAPEDAPLTDMPARAVELSGYYLSNLVEAANEIGLISYRQVESEVPYQYYDDAVILAGNQLVQNIVVYGAGYEVFGVSVGMDIRQARACLNAAGLDFAKAENGVTYEHRAVEGSPVTDDKGHDSCINVWVDENDIVTEIDWSSYTG